MSVAEYQLLNKVLTDKDFSFIADNSLTKENFPQAQEEFTYLVDFYEQYKSVPDKEKFTSVFPKFEYFTVSQSIQSIVDDIREQTLFQRAVRIINGCTELFQEDANKGVEYLKAHLNELEPSYELRCTDIIHDKSRLESWRKRQENPDNEFIELPLKELQEDLFGFKRGEELFLWLAKSGVGKSFLLTMCAECASKQGYRVGIISPELSAETLGYRFDTSRKHFSNTALQRGLLVSGYEEYYEEMCNSNEHVFIADNNDFNGVIDVQQCENFVKRKNLDILFIDGISYIKPNVDNFRYSEATLLGKTCTGLKIISDIHKIPVVGVVQARRRNSEKREDEELLSDKESVYNSLQVTQVATRMVSLNQVANALKLLVAKNRYGKEGMTYTYSYDYDRLLFTYIPSLEDINNDDETKKETKEIQKGFKNIF